MATFLYYKDKGKRYYEHLGKKKQVSYARNKNPTGLRLFCRGQMTSDSFQGKVLGTPYIELSPLSFKAIAFAFRFARQRGPSCSFIKKFLKTSTTPKSVILINEQLSNEEVMSPGFIRPASLTLDQNADNRLACTWSGWLCVQRAEGELGLQSLPELFLQRLLLFPRKWLSCSSCFTPCFRTIV